MTGSSTDIRTAIREFIAEESQVPADDDEFTDDVHLFEAGYLDSIRLVSLLAHLEQQFGVQLPEEALFSEDFTTIGGMTRLIADGLTPAPAVAPSRSSVAEPAAEHPQVRPLRREDLPGVAELYERVERSGSRRPPAGLADAFARHFLDAPQLDPAIPSLVHETDGRVDGFLGIHLRHLLFRGTPVRLACVGQFVADPDAGGGAIGTRLLTRCMAGPQEITITDGGTDDVAEMWRAFGGTARTAGDVWWIQPFRPWRFAMGSLSRRTGPAGVAGRAGRPLAAIADGGLRALTGTRFRAGKPRLDGRPLTVGALLDGLQQLGPAWDLVPDWDAPFLEWLLDEVRAVPSRGTPRGVEVADPDGSRVGWYLYYRQPGGVSQVLQVAAVPGREACVLEHLLADADRAGSAALQGRVEPNLLPALSRLNVPLRHAWCRALVRAADPEVAAAIHRGDTLLTRLEGEWWCGFQLEPYAT